jgi:hypothetical protein
VFNEIPKKSNRVSLSLLTFPLLSVPLAAPEGTSGSHSLIQMKNFTYSIEFGEKSMSKPCTAHEIVRLASDSLLSSPDQSLAHGAVENELK